MDRTMDKHDRFDLETPVRAGQMVELRGLEPLTLTLPELREPYLMVRSGPIPGKSIQTSLYPGSGISCR
jgi:hypothetical protein